MTDRERLTYTGDHDLFLPGSVGPRPDFLAPGDVVEVNRDSADLLIARGDFTLVTATPGQEHQEVPLAIDEPIPLDRLRALEESAPTTAVSDEAGHTPEPPAATVLAQLAGEELDDALADAGLPRWGDEDTKRARLQAFHSEKAHQVGTTTEAISLAALAEYAAAQGTPLNITKES